MTVHYVDDLVTLHHGDCLDVLRALPDSSVDSVVTDPPYGLEFMGREWDSFKPASSRMRTRVDARTNPAEGKSTTTTPESYAAGLPFQLWCTEWASECLRVLKPGGHMMTFGGSRTWHRLAAAVEDAGFEIRDSIAWLYGSGFPKSLDVSKAIDKAAGVDREVVGPNRFAALDGQANATVYGAASRPDETTAATDDAKHWQGWGTALKPAFEPIVVGRKPLAGTVASNVLAHGTGALNIDACRVPMTAADAASIDAKHAGMDEDAYRRPVGVALNLSTNPMPLKAAAAHTLGRWPTNVLLDESQADELDRQSGHRPAGRTPANRSGIGFTEKAGSNSGTAREPVEHDAGGASRYFPTFHYEAKAPASERPSVGGVQHPTVKPLDLMRWLVRLVTPPGGVVLEPFAGSGTTAEACVHEHMRCIAIEREADYLPLIVARLTKPIAVGFDFGDAS